VANWHWEPVTDDLLKGLPRRRGSRTPGSRGTDRPRIDNLPRRREFTGEPPGLRTVQRGPLMLVYLADVRGERVVIIWANWIG
jgi:hypothetical protein